MKIDLGCGRNKCSGFIGVDIIPYGEVDIVHDLNDRLPFETNSVAYVTASHSLQYVEHLGSVLEEIYRVCKHGSIVCIVAPYAHVTAHMVNPSFKQFFNEHSPRYWTQDRTHYVDKEEYLFNRSESWSLTETEQDIKMDLRLLRMEFFYFPTYHSYDNVELSLLRQSQLNVAYQIMYHLIVVKEEISSEELDLLIQRNWEEPAYVKEQRQLFLNERNIEKIYYTDHLSMLRSPESEPPISEVEEKTQQESHPLFNPSSYKEIRNVASSVKFEKRLKKSSVHSHNFVKRNKKTSLNKKRRTTKKKPGKNR